MAIKELSEGKFLLFDGAMGTMLQKAGLKTGELPETYNITNPEIIRGIHEEYVKAGSDVVTTNTFQANELKLKECPYSVEEIIEAGVKIAKDSGAKYVALDIGPLGQLMEPMGTVSFERAYEIFKRQIVVGAKAGADIILIETISDIYEAKAAVLAAKENCDLPVFCTLTYQEDGRTFVGTDPVTGTIVLDGLGIDAMGVNCSLGPKELKPIVDKVLEYSKAPVMIQPNAGLPKIRDGETIYDVTPQEFSEYLIEIAKNGALVLGGCCGTDPSFIKEVRSQLDKLTPVKTNPKVVTAATSGSKTVILDDVTTVIGEKINPTGKKKLKEALRTNNLDYIIGEAIDQTNSGADMLDINVGLPEIDEAEMIKKVIREVQGVVNLPLQVDSSDVGAIEAGVRIYNGKPMINSVNGKKESMEAIFPIVKKYGALILGLALDESGIPETAEGRLEIARKIVNTAAEYGIPKEDVLIDCLVLTASAQQSQVKETLKAIRLVKRELGVKTVLGVSNVSFGLPNRELINSNFLAAAFGAGLDAPIINPMSKSIMDTVNVFRVINNQDKDSAYYIEHYSNVEPSQAKEISNNGERDLRAIIIEGRKEESAPKTREMLDGGMAALDVVNNHFIPALDIVGDRFEKGQIFLPQLIQSAEAVKSAFVVIKDQLSKSEEKKESKGKIVVATVLGDIHDIGKNIVSMLLENYGFDVFDLGKDVPIEEVVRVVKEEDIKLVGLSALMTTTVSSMGETIKALRQEGLDCQVMVGGAVLNEEYTDMVGADFFAKDARESVKIANRVFGVEE
ncbi:vitamin B12-dependent methionine synthase MetH [Gottschalkia acidurici 9a]|uniref:Methionine synthase n=1 Tax=Gottschalkia acidurici (strain ATCC 7906 / DSM 604 / BCRC 14475 / CIP 104303 / KCTC 5404 / NCIMB 10678 / 9a) TaxID=1128398 RepID=K0B2Y5_GOTA9|nr:homocysteine S-methyltransferase family protein [Gottschalkia acidurici]AFS79527.1 vitamin B12-dependent methionine synthase MetH [Gottschalkia acidurici 9a]